MDQLSIYNKIIEIYKYNNKETSPIKLKHNKNYDTIEIHKNAAIRIYT